MNCPNDSQLAAFLDELLPESLSAEVAGHVDNCDRCQTRLDDIVTCGAPEGLDLRSSAPTLNVESHDQTAIAELVQRLQSAVHPLSELPERPASQRAFVTAAICESDLPVTLDHYSLLEKIGEGATGELYRAVDERLRREVAVKVLKSELAAVPTARVRFEREARACAALRHDHIIAVHHVEASHADQCPYLVMDFVQGGSLLDHFQSNLGSDLRASVEWIRQAALALQAAHDSGIVHRDIKPSNLLIDDASGRLLVVDFGLARLIESEEVLTAADAIAGTPAYMSPEQIARPRDVTGLTDVYSLGVVLYEALTGERPFRGIVRMVLNQVLYEEPVSPRRLNDRIPRDLETICLKAMAKETRLRYGSAAAFADDLNRWLAGKTVAARPVGPIGRLWRWSRRNPRLAGASAIVVLVLAAGAIDWGRYRRMSVTGELRRDWKHDVAHRDELISQNVQRAQLAEQRWLQSIQLLSLTIAELGENSNRSSVPITTESQALLETLTANLQSEEVTDAGIVGAQILGDIWSRLGNDDLAVRCYQIAADGSRNSLVKVPRNTDTTLVYVQSEICLAEFDLVDGRTDSANRRLQEALSASQKLTSRSILVPADTTASLFRLLGETAEQQQKLSLAADYYDQTLRHLSSTDSSENRSQSFDADVAVVSLKYASLLNLLDDPRAYDVCVRACDFCRKESLQSVADLQRLATAYGELVGCLERTGQAEDDVTIVMTQHAETLAKVANAPVAASPDYRNSGVAWLRLATRHARNERWAQSSSAAGQSIQKLAKIVADRSSLPADDLNLAEAELLQITIRIKDGAETGVDGLQEVGRRLRRLGELNSPDARFRTRVASLLQNCQRLILATSPTDQP